MLSWPLLVKEGQVVIGVDLWLRANDIGKCQLHLPCLDSAISAVLHIAQVRLVATEAWQLVLFILTTLDVLIVSHLLLWVVGATCHGDRLHN